MIFSDVKLEYRLAMDGSGSAGAVLQQQLHLACQTTGFIRLRDLLRMIRISNMYIADILVTVRISNK